MNYLNERFIGLLFIIIGAGFLMYGISYFVIPFSTIAGGFLILNQGLQMRNLPPLTNLLKNIFSKFK